MTNHAHTCPACTNFVDADEADIVGRAVSGFLTTDQHAEIHAGLSLNGHGADDIELSAYCRRCLVLGMAAAV